MLKHHETKETGGGKEYFIYSSILQFIIEDEQGRKSKRLELGADTEAMENCFSLAYFLCLAEIAFL